MKSTNKKIKVLHIVPALGNGGVGQFLLNYYAKIDKSKFEFYFITHDSTDLTNNNIKNMLPNIFYVKPQHLIGILAYYKSVIALLKKDYDIIHIHTGHHTGVLAMICKLCCAKRVICHAHTTRCTNKSHEKFMGLFQLLAYTFSNKMFACGEEAGKFCYGKSRKFEIIPNGVDLNVFKRTSKKEIDTLKEKLNINPNDTVLGHVGAFEIPKNHFYLIHLFKEALDVRQNIVLVLVGSGPLYNDTYKLAAQLNVLDKIRFIGQQKEVSLYMSIFDIFVFPSLFEGLPVVSAEAQAIGLKCLFSENIDHTCDLGLSLIKFLPIGENDIYLWVNEILSNCKNVTQEEINEAFKATNYDINYSVKKIEKLYFDCLC